MPVDRVTFSFGRTFNLGNFESLRIDAGLESDLLPGETFQVGVERLRKQVILDVMEAGYAMQKKLQAESHAVDMVRKRWKQPNQSNP